MAVKFCICWLKDNVLLKETPSTVNSCSSSNLFKRWWYRSDFLVAVVDYHFIRLIWVKFEVTIALAHWVMLLSSSGISDEFEAGIIRYVELNYTK